MKTYYGTFTRGVAEHKVYVRDHDDRNEDRELQHVVKHSSAGFNWGYGGSGPSELARCILLDHLGEQVRCVCGGSGQVPRMSEARLREDVVVQRQRLVTCPGCGGDGFKLQPMTYQRFKEEFVATWPMDGAWRLTSEEIESWLKGHKP